MTTEIERKFLLDKLPDNLEDEKHIIQGYLMICENGSEMRIRKYRHNFVQTIKSAGSQVRNETEIDISEEQFHQLWPLTKGKRIAKTRYIKKFDGYVYEIDSFKGKHEHLIIAEVEFKDESESNNFSPPGWLGKEITEDDKYKNKNLAG